MKDLNQFPLEDKRGITVNENGSFDVDFSKRGHWFTDEEEAVLTEAGFISQLGMYNKEFKVIKNEDGTRTVSDDYNEKPYQYSKGCCGRNTLYPSLEAFCTDQHKELIEEYSLEQIVQYFKDEVLAGKL